MAADTEARFTRIESTLVRIADARFRAEYALADAVEQIARSRKQLLTAQVLLTDAQRRTEQQFVYRQTRQRGGNGEPANW